MLRYHFEPVICSSWLHSIYPPINLLSSMFSCLIFSSLDIHCCWGTIFFCVWWWGFRMYPIKKIKFPLRFFFFFKQQQQIKSNQMHHIKIVSILSVCCCQSLLSWFVWKIISAKKNVNHKIAGDIIIMFWWWCYAKKNQTTKWWWNNLLPTITPFNQPT